MLAIAVEYILKIHSYFFFAILKIQRKDLHCL